MSERSLDEIVAGMPSYERPFDGETATEIALAYSASRTRRLRHLSTWNLTLRPGHDLADVPRLTHEEESDLVAEYGIEALYNYYVDRKQG